MHHFLLDLIGTTWIQMYDGYSIFWNNFNIYFIAKY